MSVAVQIFPLLQALLLARFSATILVMITLVSDNLAVTDRDRRRKASTESAAGEKPKADLKPKMSNHGLVEKIARCCGAAACGEGAQNLAEPPLCSD